jgi:hypothetical protein
MKVIKDPNTGRTIKVHEHIAGEVLMFTTLFKIISLK